MAKNPYLKNANEEMEYTPEQVAELQRCMKDPIYFAEKYCQIQHPVKGSVPIKLYPYQKKMLKTYKDDRSIITLSARQTGKCLTHKCTVEVVGSMSDSFINKVKRLILFIINRRVYDRVKQIYQTV